MATIDRTGAEALIPEEFSRDIIQAAPQNSAIMSLARRLPNMSRNQLRMPILSALVTAYFVDGEVTNSDASGGFKQTSRQAWANKYINAAEMAVIVPIPEAVLDDQDYDIWGEVRPRIVEAFGAAFDAAVVYGTNAPTDWPDDLLTGAVAAGQTVSLAASTDVYDAILGEGGTLSMVEEDGYGVNGHLGALRMKAKLRGLRDANGNPIFNRNAQSAASYDLDGAPATFPLNGFVDPAQSLLISGDWNQLVYSVRQDVTYRILDQAVIQDTEGNIIYNLAQQDMVAMRAVFRLGWQLPNPLNRVNSNDATRYPFAVLVP
jgi:HK97 family phage major capsid protein